MSVKTLEEVGQLLEQSAAESKRTNELIAAEIVPRLDRNEAAIKATESAIREAGILNGHAGDFKRMVEQYRHGMELSQARSLVRADLGRKLGFLRQPKALLRAFFFAVIGGLGWQLVSHPPHVPFLH